MDNPADTDRWLLTPSSPALPRVIDAVRPLVLPKLREENAAARAKKGGKRKGWKDEVVGGTCVSVSISSVCVERGADVVADEGASADRGFPGCGFPDRDKFTAFDSAEGEEGEGGEGGKGGKAGGGGDGDEGGAC